MIVGDVRRYAAAHQPLAALGAHLDFAGVAPFRDALSLLFSSLYQYQNNLPACGLVTHAWPLDEEKASSAPRGTASAANVSNASSVFVYNGAQSNEQFVFAYAVDSTTDDIYIHMSAPAGNSWMAVGAGSSMKDTLMLVAYASSNGTGVTLSPRTSTGHNEPSYTYEVTCELVYADDLVDGNTVTDYGYQGSGLFGSMTVNAVCHNATQSHSPATSGFPVGGSSDAMSDFIFAVGPGSVGNNNLQSNSLTASLREHNFYGQFKLNTTAATAATGTQAQVPRPNASNNTYTLSSASEAAYATHADNDPAPIIHAGVMCITFVLLYPLGAIFLRILNNVKSHAIIQSIALVLTTMATAGGIVISGKYNKSKSFTSAHQILGILIFLALYVQLILGILNHRAFKKTGQKTTMGKVHLYLGPSILLLGWINAPLGFVFGGNPHACLPYIVILLAVIIIYCSLRFCSSICCGRRLKKKNNNNNGQTGEAMPSAADEGYQYPRFGGVHVGGEPEYMPPPPMYSRHPYERQPSYRSEDVMLRPYESQGSGIGRQAQPRGMI